tara:strand:- start:83 stop:262 length:180 start_codon:yes stop_codon:yes gene_type:complete
MGKGIRREARGKCRVCGVTFRAVKLENETVPAIRVGELAPHHGVMFEPMCKGSDQSTVK